MNNKAQIAGAIFILQMNNNFAQIYLDKIYAYNNTVDVTGGAIYIFSYKTYELILVNSLFFNNWAH